MVLSRSRIVTVAAVAGVLAAGGCTRPGDAPEPSPSPTVTTAAPSPDPTLSTASAVPTSSSSPAPVPSSSMPAAEAWLRAVLSWRAGDQDLDHVLARAARYAAPDLLLEVLPRPVLDAAIGQVDAHLGTSTVTSVADVTDPDAYPDSSVRVLTATVEFAGAGGWTYPPLQVTAEIQTVAGLVVAVQIADGAVTAGGDL